MPYGITQCYLPLGDSAVPAITPAKVVCQFSDVEGCKAELTWVVVICGKMESKNKND